MKVFLSLENNCSKMDMCWNLEVKHYIMEKKKEMVSVGREMYFSKSKLKKDLVGR